MRTAIAETVVLVVMTYLLAACGASPAAAPGGTPAASAVATAPRSAPAATEAALATSSAPLPTPSPPAELLPLDAVLQQRLSSIRTDPPPPTITRNRHYLVSNEDGHHQFQPVVADRGGIQIGVGAEQNYLLAGWARPEVLILMDYDEWVTDLNWVYGLLFEHAATPDDFVALWEFGRDAQVVGWIEDRWPDPKVSWKKVRVYRHARAEVHHRLDRLRRRHREHGVPCFLDDPAQYDHLVRLWHTGRFHSVRGDLVQRHTMQDIAEFARAAGIPVRVLYLSNAEDYFWYDRASFTANMLALPYDEQSLVLHTKPYDGDYYRYVYQSGSGYQHWLRSGQVRSWCELFAYAAPVGEGDAQQDLRVISVSPESAPPLPRRLPCSQPAAH